MEGLRYLPFLDAEGWLITSSNPFINIDHYPDQEILDTGLKKVKNHRSIDAAAIAKEVGSHKVSNMVMLGAAMDILGLQEDKIAWAIGALFGRKGEDVVKMNIDAIDAGRKAEIMS
jgi:indolepyruvate ferredoxin oxidoreductase beta subunit